MLVLISLVNIFIGYQFDHKPKTEHLLYIIVSLKWEFEEKKSSAYSTDILKRCYKYHILIPKTGI